jgi:TMEM175 potassium channel family protein
MSPHSLALWPLWPTAISCAVSYVFIAIIWINHHYLVRFVGPPSLGLIWINFVHLFMVSLVPFATACVARSRLASPAVAFYAGLFVCVDIAYNVFEREVFRAEPSQVSARARGMARRRSLAVLAIFTSAILVAFVAPRLGFGLRSQNDDDVANRLCAAHEEIAVGGLVERLRSVHHRSRHQPALTVVTHTGAARPADRNVARFGQLQDAVVGRRLSQGHGCQRSGRGSCGDGLLARIPAGATGPSRAAPMPAESNSP